MQHLVTEKKNWPPTKFDILKAFGLKLYASTMGKVEYFFDLNRIRENKRRNANF